jgi:hypothetical protein
MACEMHLDTLGPVGGDVARGRHYFFLSLLRGLPRPAMVTNMS